MKKLKLIEGQDVMYEGNKTHIETLNNDGTCVIANPDWDWDEEGECVSLGVDYDMPYWIKVKITELF